MKRLVVGVFGDKELALIAAVHEYGAPTKGIPARSFLRTTMYEGRAKYHALLAKVLKEWQKGIITVDEALNRLGLVVSNDVKARIIRGLPPPLTEKTIKRKLRKGSPRPRTALYDTGRMYEHIRAKVLGGAL